MNSSQGSSGGPVTPYSGPETMGKPLTGPFPNAQNIINANPTGKYAGLKNQFWDQYWAPKLQAGQPTPAVPPLVARGPEMRGSPGHAPTNIPVGGGTPQEAFLKWVQALTGGG